VAVGPRLRGFLRFASQQYFGLFIVTSATVEKPLAGVGGGVHVSSRNVGEIGVENVQSVTNGVEYAMFSSRILMHCSPT
jgi:hypothetical protein